MQDERPAIRDDSDSQSVREALARIWSDVTGKSHHGQVDFAQAGGSSLDLVELQLRLMRETNRLFKIEDLPFPPTFEGILDVAMTSTSVEPPSALHDQPSDQRRDDSTLRRVTMKGPATLTQYSQWMQERAHPLDPGNTIPFLVRFRRDTEWSELNAALTALVEIHPALRTAVRLDSSEPSAEPIQIVLPPPRRVGFGVRSVVDFEPHSLSPIIDGLMQNPPCLETGEVCRVVGLIMGGHARGVLLLLHHAVVDEPSLRIIESDLLDLIDGNSPPLERETQLNWAVTQSMTQSDEKSIAWWTQTLSRVPEDLNLTPSGKTDRSRRITLQLEEDVKSEFERRSREAGISRAAGVAHAFAQALQGVGIAPQGPFAIGVPASLRDSHMLDRTVGMLLNTMPVVFDPGHGLLDSGNSMRRAWRHRRLCYQDILEVTQPNRSSGRPPWLDAMIGIIETNEDFSASSLGRELFSGGSPSPIFLTVVFSPGSIELMLDLNQALVSEALGDRLASVIEGRIRLLEDVPNMLSELAGTVIPEDDCAGSLPGAVVARAMANPEAVAVFDEDGIECSYGELVRDAHRIRTAIEGAGVVPGASLAIFASPGIGYYKTLLGIAMARCGPMPITPDVPTSRVREMLETVAPKLVLTVEDPDPAMLEGLPKSSIRSVQEILAASPDPAVTDLRGIRERIESVDADPCFVLFTSGSTGVPKVVRGTNASLSNLVRFEVDRCGPEYVGMTGQYAPLGFDVAFQEIYSTLVAGGALCPFPLEVRSDPDEVAAFIEQRGITRTFLPPLMLRAVGAVSEEGFPSCLREILCIGEQLRIDDAVRRAAGTRGTLRIVNQYGPAEAPQVTCLDLGEDPLGWDDRPTIGGPIRNVLIRIEDEQGNAVPVGTNGEVMIGGVAVGLGYANDPMNSRFTEEDGVRWYRTGDLGRVLPSGEIEFVGRIDHQVKVAGHRVEPLEVEQAIGRLPEVVEVGVVAWSSDDVVRLVAYAEAGVDGEVIRQRLSDVLPPWLVPTSIVIVDEIPRNSNGKVDRTALRTRAERLGSEEEAPGSTLDEDLMSTLHAFGLPAVMRPHDDASLVEQGLDSLGAIRMQLKLREAGHAGIDIGVILRSTPKRLVELLVEDGDTRRRRATVPATQIPREEAVVPENEEWTSLDPLSRDLIYQAAISPAGSYHLAWRVEIPSSRTLEYVRERVAGMSRDWSTLRTARDPERGCRILSSGIADTGMVEAFESEPSRREIEHLLRHPFDLRRGDCYRAASWTVPGRRIVLLVFHHVAVDGRAAGSIIDSAFGHPTLPTNSVQANPAVPSVLREAEDWWVARLADDLKGDSLPRRSPDASDESILFKEIAPEGRGFGRCVEASIRNSGSPIALAVLAWGLILGRRLGKDRTVIGLPFASESTSAELGVSLLPIVIPVGDDVTINEALESTSNFVLGGLENRQASLGSLIRRLEPDEQRLHPPFDGVFTQDDLHRESGEAKVLWEPVGRGPFQATLVVPGIESQESPLGLEINEWMLDGEHADSFIDRFFEILRQLTQSLETGRGNQLLGSIDSIGESSNRQIRSFERSDAFEDGAPSVAAAFEASVARNPDAIAIVDGGLPITYGELDSWSRAIASDLIRKGIGHGEAVALTGFRSASTIAGMLGVARAGGFFVPIDSSSPEARIRAQMSSVRPRFGVGPKISTVLSGNVPEWIDLDAIRASKKYESLPVLGSETPFYAMFTSGTTGEPRGALVPHRAVLRLTQDPWFLPKSPNFKMLHAAPIAFDASTLEIWWPLLNGLTVVCWDGRGSDLQGIGALIRRERIDGCWLTAALFHAAVDQMPHVFESMSVVLTGGDVVSAAHAARIGSRYPDLVLVNGYGPTENTVFTTCDLITVERGQINKPVSIGRPVRGTRVRILDPRGKRVPIGRFGELVTDGAGLAIGYLDPVSNVKLSGGFEGGTSKGTLYRTGDRARWLQDGRIEFNGRIDHQVKVNGHRVELSAIDSAIRRMAQVEDAATMLLETPGRSKSIGAVIVQSARGSIDRESVRSTLASELPAWEIPTEIMFVDRIPSTRNGKVDRKACAGLLLESRNSLRPTESVVEEKADEIDVILRRAIEEISGRRVDSRSMTLSEVGIDSIELLRLSLRLEDLFSRPIHLESLVVTASLGEIAAAIRDDIQLESKDVVELRPPEAITSRAVFCVPGVGGTVFSFLALLDGIPRSIPVHGLPYPGVGGSRPPLRSIEAMAEHFAKSIIATGVKSPCLVGYSLGGFVTFELARNLKQFGLDPSVVIIDAPLSQLPRRLKWSGRKIVTRAELRVRLANVLPDAMAGVMAGKDGRRITSLRRVIAGSFSAWRAYSPKSLDLDLTLVRSRDDIQEAERHDPTLGWREVARSVTLQEIPGSHLEVFRVGSMELSRIIVDVIKSK